MTIASSPTHHSLTPHARFSVEQFHRLCEAVPEQRLELIEGEVLEVIAKGTRHSAVVNQLLDLIAAQLREQPTPIWMLRVESPLDLGISNEPEPDLALVRHRQDAYLHAHPTVADTLLVIEVADSSLRFDLEAKACLYAAAGVPHYLVIDVQNPRLLLVEQHRPAEPLLTTLRAAIEGLLEAIPPA